MQVSVSASRYSCAIRVGGDVVCWGNPSYGITGTPEYDGIPFLQVTTARTFACGLKVRTQRHAVIRPRDHTQRHTATHSHTATHAVAALTHAACRWGVQESGKLVCWGDSSDFKAARGDTHEYIEISSWCAWVAATASCPSGHGVSPLRYTCRQHTLCGIDANPPHGIRCWGSDKIESKPDFHTAV